MNENNDLERKVYEKLEKELEEFLKKEELKKPDEIIKDAYQITIKKEFLYMFDNTYNYDDDELLALLEEDNLLDYFYDEWLDVDSGVSESLEDTVRDCVKDIRKQYNEKINQNKTKSVKSRDER